MVKEAIGFVRIVFGGNMEKLVFKVSAKTARLIGRENITDVDGAIVELVKNGYDADASCVFVYFDMPYPNVPKEFKNIVLEDNFTKEDLELIYSFYEIKNNSKIVLRSNVSQNDIHKLEDMFFKYNKIIIADNGCGMSKHILETSWMNIGTSDKEHNYTSTKGRIKTGAKGIGRFALDKLSKASLVYTQSKDDSLYSWKIDWDSFEKCNLIEEVDTYIEQLDCDLKAQLKNLLPDEYNLLTKNYDWSTGTIIVLTPTRESWSKRLFKRVNNNLHGLNPYGNVDVFNVLVKNKYYSEFNLFESNNEIDDYDYKIFARFDGKRYLNIALYRNEVDTTKVGICDIHDDKYNIDYKVNLTEFWNLENVKEYFDKDTTNITLDCYELSDIKDDFLDFSEVGPFESNLYFIKNSQSTVEIIKKINVRNRKEMIDKFSGIKIYRDNFKIRPYGDDGSLFDWLNLNARHNLKPAGISDTNAPWAVLPYQIFGNVLIKREENPGLYDKANREGLTMNKSYSIFVSLLTHIIEIFERDRQDIYRLFSDYKRGKLEKLRGKSKKLIDDVKNNPNNLPLKELSNYSEEDYRDAIKQQDLVLTDTQRVLLTMMAFNASGVLSMTFAHEIKGIESELISRNQSLERSIKRLIKEYDGDPDLNPFDILEESKETDKALANWIDIIMKTVANNNYHDSEFCFFSTIEEILSTWELLLSKKKIKVITYTECKDDIIKIERIKIYLLLNNFILNSVYFLKNNTVGRIIKITLEHDMNNNEFKLIMENNGPRLDKKFENNPRRIFEPGVSSKSFDEGTGLGLWICKEIVEQSNGTIDVLKKDDGFGLVIKLPSKS